MEFEGFMHPAKRTDSATNKEKTSQRPISPLISKARIVIPLRQVKHSRQDTLYA